VFLYATCLSPSSLLPRCQNESPYEAINVVEFQADKINFEMRNLVPGVILKRRQKETWNGLFSYTLHNFSILEGF